MFKNYIKIAWRSLKANRLFSIINVLGLSMGITITLVLFLFLRKEQGFDQFYQGESNVYRVLLHTDSEAFDKETWAGVPAALAPAMKTDIPNVKHAARILKNGFGANANIKANNTTFVEKGLYWCDTELFDILKINLLNGKREELNRPNTIALSQETAQLYFGDTNPIGKQLNVDNIITLEVIAVYEKPSDERSFDFNAIASFSTMGFYKSPSWSNASFETLVQFDKAVSLVSKERQMQELLDKNVDKEGQWFSFSLQPMEKIHLYSAGYMNSYASNIGDINEIKYLSILVFLILCIACINYMNLTTARSQKRAKEVGINKTLGASKASLVVRFYVETGLVTFLSIGIGGLLTFFAIPVFNRLTGHNLDQSSIFGLDLVWILLGVWAFITLVAGSYPALYLSKFSAKSTISSSVKTDIGAIFIRKGLVVFQFAASVVLIVGILLVYQQIQMIKHKKLGFEKENVIAIGTSAIKEESDRKALERELHALSQVTSVAMAQGFPGMEVSTNTIFRNQDDSEGKSIQTNVADTDIVAVLKLQLLAGTSLPKTKQVTDTLLEAVLNKKAIEYLGYSPEEAINKDVYMGQQFTIVGVVDDFNYASLHKPIGPYAFTNSKRETKSYALVRCAGASKGLVGQLESTFKKIAPDAAFDYSFLDKNIERLYEREQRTARLGLLFCALAIFVACLGLFGLAAFMAEQRKKEIGVRKVLGASILNIAHMLSSDFIKLVLLALVIAFPMAFLLMENWLQGFAYRIRISWVVFAISGIMAVCIALATVSFQAIKAAMANPVKSLRTE